MRVQAARTFRDAETGQIHQQGEVFEVSKERMAEIRKAQKKGGKFVEVVEGERENPDILGV